MDEIKNDIQKRRLRWFGHVMWMGEERIPKKMPYINRGKNNQDDR